MQNKITHDNTEEKTLGLFFTAGVSLQTWLDVGNFDREKAIYEKHLDDGIFTKIHWFTYGTRDQQLAEKLQAEGRLHPGIAVHPKPAGFNFPGGSLVYSFLLQFLKSKNLREVGVYKTNQMSGAWTALIAAALYKKPVFLRTGYTWSIFADRQNKGRLKKTWIHFIEKWAYKSAAVAAVTSEGDRKYIIEKYKTDPEKIHFVPNYIDTDLFYDQGKQRVKDRLVSVTRLTKQKNLENVIRALPGSRFGLDLYYGGGDMEEELRALVEDINADVQFLGSVPNDQLPEILNNYQYFILPSLYEGMPKTLLEAMACGCVCGGTKVPGIEEVIVDNRNGVLVSGTQKRDMDDLFGKLRTCDENSLSSAAVDTIQKEYSLSAVAESERLIFQDLVSDK